MSPPLAPLTPTPTTRIVNASGLRLRALPALTADVLAILPRGTIVQILELADADRWSRVQAGRSMGWMATKYLIGSSATAPVSEAEEFPWMPVALAELGVRETPGIPSTPRVVEYLRSTDLDQKLAAQDSTPWCSGFVNWCVERSGYAGSNSAAARSWLSWGRPLLRPRRGCIVVFDRGQGGGHVGFYLSKGQTGAGIDVLGGNQGDQVQVACYGAHLLLGYRVPH